MGYALKYDLQSIKVTKNKTKSGIIRYAAMTAVLILCTLAMHFGGSVFQTIVLGERQTAKAAAEQMVSNIKEGASFEDAIETFYSELSE